MTQLDEIRNKVKLDNPDIENDIREFQSTLSDIEWQVVEEVTLKLFYKYPEIKSLSFEKRKDIYAWIRTLKNDVQKASTEKAQKNAQESFDFVKAILLGWVIELNWCKYEINTTTKIPFQEIQSYFLDVKVQWWNRKDLEQKHYNSNSFKLLKQRFWIESKCVVTEFQTVSSSQVFNWTVLEKEIGKERLSKLTWNLEKMMKDFMRDSNSYLSDRLLQNMSIWVWFLTLDILSKLDNTTRNAVFDKLENAKNSTLNEFIISIGYLVGKYDNLRKFWNKFNEFLDVLNISEVKEKIWNWEKNAILSNPSKLQSLLSEYLTWNKDKNWLKNRIISAQNDTYTTMTAKDTENLKQVTNNFTKTVGKENMGKVATVWEAVTGFMEWIKTYQWKYRQMALDHWDEIMTVKGMMESFGMWEFFKKILDWVFKILWWKNWFDDFAKELNWVEWIEWENYDRLNKARGRFRKKFEHLPTADGEKSFKELMQKLNLADDVKAKIEWFNYDWYKWAIAWEESNWVYECRNDQTSRGQFREKRVGSDGKKQMKVVEKRIDCDKWAFGKYQFTAETLLEYNVDVYNSTKTDIDEVKLKAFLDNRQLQEQIMNAYTNKCLQKILTTPDYINKVRNSYDVYNLLAINHIWWGWALSNFVKNRKLASDYMWTSPDQKYGPAVAWNVDKAPKAPTQS